MRTRYAGTCHYCGEHTPAHYGHFEKHKSGWKIRCLKCVKPEKQNKRDIKVLEEKREQRNREIERLIQNANA